MTEEHRPVPPDGAARQSAVAERARNVLIDAGAGTGKTTILVQRLVELLAPSVSGASPIPLARLAAVTFTRKAAGELKLRLREALLAALSACAGAASAGARAEWLRQALAGLDTASIGTIHGFAEKLLRREPVAARISPSYEIAEGDAMWDLIASTTTALVEGVEGGRLADALRRAPAVAQALAAEVEATVKIATEVGIFVREREWNESVILPGLETLVACFAQAQDAPPDLPPPPDSPLPDFRAAAALFVGEGRLLTGTSMGSALLRDRIARVGELRDETDPVKILRALNWLLKDPDLKKGKHFPADKPGWALCKETWDETKAPDGLTHRERLLGPFSRWLGARLVRAFPVVVALYEQTKARAKVLDQTDLLLKLRDLLRDHPDIRRTCAASFDHILVDEFQDTDPLQAEILLFLCLEPSRASDALRQPLAGDASIALRPGSLTVVGDPKQSIYRFRRADIETYDKVRAIIARAPHLDVTLSTNFRSVPALIAWGNQRFEKVLGQAPEGSARLFDAQTGTVFCKPLHPGRATPAAAPVPVHALGVGPADGEKLLVADYRALEAESIARYVRWLTGPDGPRITDPDNGEPRAIGPSDIAVLSLATFGLPALFGALDRHDIPYASRGGTLFLRDPLHQQFLLGLRALSDPSDGAARASLLRPPFFALDPGELLAGEQSPRARHAHELLAGMRKQRSTLPPGATVRALLEQTGFGRAVALGPNGEQRLARLRELVLLADTWASRDGLDFDAITARLRAYVEEPVQRDPPRPVGSAALSVLTVHQAKGLEWPVVILWDGCAAVDVRVRPFVFRAGRDGHSWSIKLGPAEAAFPPGNDLKTRDDSYDNAERRRLLYVAATRARELFAFTVPEGYRANVVGTFWSEGSPEESTRRFETMRPGAPAPWAIPYPPIAAAEIIFGDGADEARIVEERAAALTEATRPRFVPVGVSRAVRAAPAGEAAEAELSPPALPDETTPEEEETAAQRRTGRHGPVFGTTVHLALAHMLGATPRGGNVAATTAVEAAVARARAVTGLHEHLDEARADVTRTVAALAALGIQAGDQGLHVEFPVGGSGPDGTLLTGFIDLLWQAKSGARTRTVLIDFKTDAPPPAGVRIASTHAHYVAQVNAYASLLALPPPAAQAQLTFTELVPSNGPSVERALLFTADGSLHWIT